MPLRNLPAEVAQNIRLWIRGAVRFAGAGAGAFFVLLGGTALLIEVFHWDQPRAYGLMLLAVTFLNFIIQQRIVFDHRQFDVTKTGRMLRFMGTALFFRVAEWGMFTTLVAVIQFHYVPAGIFTAMTMFFGKYVMYDRWVFKQKKPGSSFENPS